MKTTHLHLFLFILFLGCTSSLTAQYKWFNPQKESFPVVRGQAWQEDPAGFYTRLPQRAKDKVRKAVWDLSLQSAGLSIAFRSNAPEIKIRYVVKGALSMPHMPATGVSGIDLYATDNNGQERWCVGRYVMQDTITYDFSGLSYAAKTGKSCEYQLFLPLYNSVSWLEIGVPENTSFRFLPVSQEKPLVIYGTSIAQGACASRPGMAWGNILNRKSEHPVINLGFSGNGKLESELFDLLSEIDAKLFIIDCMPNLPGKSAEVIYNRTLKGVKKLRETSKAPILLVEHDGYANDVTSEKAEESYRVANTELRKAYNTLQEEQIPDIYYLTKEEIGIPADGMVDGVHSTDLGMQQYADSYLKKIREILHEKNEGPTSCIPCKQQRDSYDWYARHEEILKLNRENAPEIIMIGNSSTHYWAGEPTAPTQRGKEAWDKLFKNRSVRNLGFGWDKTENVLWRIYHGELDGFKANMIFLLIGTNNLQFNTDKEILQGILQVTEAIKIRQPQAKLCVMGILPRANTEKRIQQINKELRKKLEQNCIYINLSNLLTDKNGIINSSLFSDGLHPNTKGYEKIAEVLKTYLDN